MLLPPLVQPWELNSINFCFVSLCHESLDISVKYESSMFEFVTAMSCLTSTTLSLLVRGQGCDTPPSLLLFLVSPSLMARARLRRCPQQGQRPCCPSCGKRFTNVLRHLNHPLSKCVDWFNATTPHRHLSSHPYGNSTEEPMDFPILDNPPNIQRVPPLSHCQPHAQCVELSGAAMTYGQVKSFMDWFNDD